MTDIDDRRRRLLAAVGAAAATGAAGCLGEPGAGAGGGADDGPDGPAGSGYVVDDHPIETPMEFTGEHKCAVCAMTPANYADWMGQLAHEDGTGVFFCTPGCLTAYVAVPDYFGGPDAAVGTAWTTEFETGELIDATAAYFVLERAENPDEPMHPNPRVFADREDADAYVDGSDDLGADDVIRFEGIDLDVARMFREYRLP